MYLNLTKKTLPKFFSTKQNPLVKHGKPSPRLLYLKSISPAMDKYAIATM